ncbi:MAG: adenosine deaminase [Chloroflexi bacterium]|nr:adenosine deaminase [Chloroflexota bacterium]
MQIVTPEQRQLIRAMPKAEVHIHLEGAIQPATVLKLAKQHNLLHTLPGKDVAAIQKWFTFTDFPHFIQVYLTITDLIRNADDFALIAYECGADMARQNIRYREVTMTPYSHTNYLDKSVRIEDILSGLEAGRQRAKADFGVEIRWVFDIPRNFCFSTGAYDPQPAKQTLAFALAGQDKGVVGFGLGGNEVDSPPEPFAHAFMQAKEAGLLSVPHAGETMGAESIWGAIKDLQADRIGHGVRAIEDANLIALLKERQIPLEINPTSNECLHIYDNIADHPFAKLDQMGLLVTVNSDDPPLFNTTLTREYERVVQDFDYDLPNLVRIARNAYVVAGVESDVKARLLSEFDAWVESNLGAR